MSHFLHLAIGVALVACHAMAYSSPKLSAKLVGMTINDTSPEIVGGAAHECYRECVEGDVRTCNYKFTLIEYSTMAIVCGDCPYTVSDCYNKGCITAGGIPREIRVVNHMLPGPSVQVCKGDTIRVELANDFGSDSATIHWHGIHQKDTPYMDGVPYVTQCPVQPGNRFVYNFTADPIGTHIWHSHIGIQEPDGFFGSLVVRGANDILAQYYDYDLAEHVMVIWHWFDQPTSSIVKSTFFRSVAVLGQSLIINGYASSSDYSLGGINFSTPRANFTVKQGFRYRFRLIANMAIYCPVQVSVDDHTLLVIASDGASFEPVEVESLIVNAGERMDVVLTADRPSGNYWIKFRGLGNCALNLTYALATLHYEDAILAEPLGSITYLDTGRSGVLLNPVGLLATYPFNTLVSISDLKTTSEDAVDVSGEPDYTFYWSLGLNIYPQFQTPGPWAQIDEVSFDYPPVPFLTQYDEITSDMYCQQHDFSNADCYQNYCTCPTIYAVELGSLVEMVFYDNTFIFPVDHPMHMHGGSFRVVAMEYGDGTLTLDDVKARNENGGIRKNFDTAPLKDVIGIPARGFAVLRFRADNPGYWFVHCHVAVHSEEGMAFVLKVGNDSQMIHPPDDFPTCGNYDITSNTTGRIRANRTSAESDQSSDASPGSTIKPTSEVTYGYTSELSSEVTSKPTIEATSRNSSKPTSGYATKPASEATSGHTTKLTTEVTSGYTFKPTSGYASKPASGYITKLTTEATSGYTTKPTTEVTSGYTSKPSSENITTLSSEATFGYTSKPTSGYTSKTTSQATSGYTTKPTTEVTAEYTSKPTTEVISEYTSKPTSGYASKPASGYTTMPTSEATFGYISKPASEATSGYTTMLTTEVTSGYTFKPTSGYASKPASGYTTKLTTEATSGYTTEPTTEITSEYTSKPSSENTTTLTSEATSGYTPKPTTEVTAGYTSKPTTEVTSEYTSKPTSGYASKPASENTTTATSEATFGYISKPSSEVTSGYTSKPTSENTTTPTSEATFGYTSEPSSEVTSGYTSKTTSQATSGYTTKPTTEVNYGYTAKPTSGYASKPTSEVTSGYTFKTTSGATPSDGAETSESISQSSGKMPYTVTYPGNQNLLSDMKRRTLAKFEKLKAHRPSQKSATSLFRKYFPAFAGFWTPYSSSARIYRM